MGKDKTKQQAQGRQTDIYNRSVDQYNQSKTPTALENEMTPISQNFMGNYNTAVGQNTKDYGNIMGGYQDYMQNIPKPTQFAWNKVDASRPAELGESYDTLRSALPGYREFAATGGYSPQDIQELRARGTSPIRAAYGNANMQLDRSKALGSGGANYNAAAAKMARESAYGMSDAMTNVNAGLADAIRQGRLSGLAGVSGIGSTMGGLSSAEAQRMLQANMANSQGSLQAAGMSEQSMQDSMRNRLAGLSGQTSLYGTTPAMSAMFGNQALNAYGQRAGLESNRMSQGTNAISQQIAANNPFLQKNGGTPWWQTALGLGKSILPYLSGGGGGDKGVVQGNYGTDIDWGDPMDGSQYPPVTNGLPNGLPGTQGNFDFTYPYVGGSGNYNQDPYWGNNRDIMS